MASLIETDCSTPEPQTRQDILDRDSFLAPVKFSFLGSSIATVATVAVVYSGVLFCS